MFEGYSENHQHLYTCFQQGLFDGYLKHAVNKLLPRLPYCHLLKNREELLSEVRLWTIEAINFFDPERIGTNGEYIYFEVYLFQHLRIRSYQVYKTAWLQKKQGKNKVNSLKEYEDFVEINPRSSFPMELHEFLNSLTSQSRKVVLQLLKVNEEKLLRLFTRRFTVTHKEYIPGMKKLVKLTGLPRYEITNTIKEVKNKIPYFVCGF